MGQSWGAMAGVCCERVVGVLAASHCITQDIDMPLVMAWAPASAEELKMERPRVLIAFSVRNVTLVVVTGCGRILGVSRGAEKAPITKCIVRSGVIRRALMVIPSPALDVHRVNRAVLRHKRQGQASTLTPR